MKHTIIFTQDRPLSHWYLDTTYETFFVYPEECVRLRARKKYIKDIEIMVTTSSSWSDIQKRFHVIELYKLLRDELIHPEFSGLDNLFRNTFPDTFPFIK